MAAAIQRSRPTCSKLVARLTACASFSTRSDFGRPRTSTCAAAIRRRRPGCSPRSLPLRRTRPCPRR